MMFLHLFRIDLLIFLLCFCYLYCSKMVKFILFLWFTNMRFTSSCLLVCPIVLRLLPVLSWTALWVLIDFHHKVALRCQLTLGSCSSCALSFVLDLCICLWYRQSLAKYFSSCKLDCYWLVVMLRTSRVRVFCLWSVSADLGRMANLRLVDKQGNLSSWSYKY
jgi:hypothetical protein